MRFYTVHLRPPRPELKGASGEPDVVFIRDGFSWLAFLLTPVYLLWHRQWLGLAIFVGLSASLSGLSHFLGLGISGDALFSFSLSFLIGLSANDWRRWRLSAAGYREAAAVGASGREEAEIRFFASWPETGAAA